MILAITKVMVDFPASLDVPNIDIFFSLEPFLIKTQYNISEII